MPQESLSRFATRALVVAAFVALGYVVWKMQLAVLIAFAAVLPAILFDAFARLLRRLTRLPQRLSAAAAVGLLCAMPIGVGYAMGRRLGRKFSQVISKVNQGYEQLPEDLRSLVGDGSAALGTVVLVTGARPALAAAAPGAPPRCPRPRQRRWRHRPDRSSRLRRWSLCIRRSRAR